VAKQIPKNVELIIDELFPADPGLLFKRLLTGVGTSDFVGTYADLASIPLTGNDDGDIAFAIAQNRFYRWNRATTAWVTAGGGGGGASDWGDIGGTLSDQTDLQAALNNKEDLISSDNNQVLYKNNSGLTTGFPSFYRDTSSGGILFQITEEPNGETQNRNLHSHTLTVNPLTDSPGVTWNFDSRRIEIDPNSSGFDFGVGGNALRFQVNNAVHFGTSDIGSIEFIQNNFELGNGTDPITVNGLAYMFGFGQFRAGVTLDGPIQGYGFQPNLDPAAFILSTEYVQGFYDAANLGSPSPNYTSFNASPTLHSIQNNHNFDGVRVSPNIDEFTGNANFTGIGIYGNYGDFGTGNWIGLNVNPTIVAPNLNYAVGISVSLDNVTAAPGVAASLVIQDLTIEWSTPGEDANNYSIEYVGGGTAGNEGISISGNLVTVSIEDGVSTAENIRDAIEANLTIGPSLIVTISGVASNPQTANAPVQFSGGVNPGRKLAAFLDGDVEITGGLSFQGALSIGSLSAFSQQPLIDGGGTPSSIHALITAPTVAANTTVANADFLGINTASLMQFGDNSTITTGFLGVTALGLPAVLGMGVGSTVDRVGGAVFALSLDAGATGGTADIVSLCRSLAIPNGITTVNRLYGYEFDLPFGNPATNAWGLYLTPDVENWIKGNLRIGGTAGSDDVATAGYNLDVTGDSLLRAKLQHDGSEAGFFGVPAVAQPTSSGAATAGATYTATEQAMLQQVYDAMRTLGLMS